MQMKFASSLLCISPFASAIGYEMPKLNSTLATFLPLSLRHTSSFSCSCNYAEHSKMRREDTKSKELFISRRRKSLIDSMPKRPIWVELLSQEWKLSKIQLRNARKARVRGKEGIQSRHFKHPKVRTLQLGSSQSERKQSKVGED